MEELNTLYQQMGEVLRGLRALSETIDIRDQQTQRMQDLVRADLATLRQDQRDLEEKVECVICVVQHDLEALRTGAADSRRSIDDLVGAVNALRKPIVEIMALRSRVAGLIVGVGVLGGAVLWLAEPVYRWAVEHHLPRS